MPTRSDARPLVVLPPLTAAAAAAVLAPPRLPAEVASVPLACRAAAGAIPVLLRAPAAGGRLLLARALHALAGREGSLVVATGRRPALERVPAGATLYLDAAALAPDGALALEALLDDARVWVLAGAEPGAVLPGALGARLSAVVLTVPPLAARAAELPALAAAVVEGLGRRLGIAPPRLAADALERLSAHAWPGDLAELEAALARALPLAGGGVIERMDGLLENVLAFARRGAPHREAVEVGPILARVLAELEPELAGRSVRVRQAAAPTAHCAADPQHLAYALRNLLVGVAREVPAREQLMLDATANGVVTLRFTAGAEAADRLRRLAAPGEATSLGDPTLLPLAFRLARAVLERNGGTLAVVPEAGEATSVVIRLPTPPAEEARP